MFGFSLKKEYVLNKIKEYLNYEDELDFSNLPESFKDVIENRFSIECLNDKEYHIIINEIKQKLNELNPECDIEKLINLVCFPDGKLNIGFVMKDELQIIKSFSSSLNRSQYFNETSIQNILNELKEFIGFQHIQSDINHLEIKLVFDYERFGISFIHDFIDSDGPALTKELIRSLLDPNDTNDYNKLIQFV